MRERNRSTRRRAGAAGIARPREPKRARKEPRPTRADIQEALAEALEQQKSTSQVLVAISRSPFELEKTLQTIVEQGMTLCRASMGRIFLIEGRMLRERVRPGGVESSRLAGWSSFVTVPIDRRTLVGRAVLEARTQHAPDIRLEPEIAFRDPPLTRLAVPITSAGTVLGVLNFHRAEVAPFSPAQIALTETFADQAAIAIENVRLFNETKEALERQTAIGEILRVISTSPTDIQPVLDAIATNAARFCVAEDAVVTLVDDDELRVLAHAGSIGTPGSFPIDRGSVTGRAILDRRMVHVPDVLAAEEDYPRAADFGRSFGFKAMVSTPLVRDDRAIGAIGLRRAEAKPFTERQVDLLQTFADQAVIAIENVRLFNETKEALEQQTATGEVLGVISRSAGDELPALDVAIRNAVRLARADRGFIVKTTEDGRLPIGAWAGDERTEDFRHWYEETLESSGGSPPDRGGPVGRSILERKPVHIPDVLADPEFTRFDFQRAGAFRTALGIPLLRGERVLGGLALVREEVRPFTDREIAIAATFADQAAIAIENARLFNETQEKSRQLQAASRHKSEFLANMSHELRTPLNAIIGFSEVLLARMFGELNERQREYLEDIRSSGQHQLTLINEVLDLSKVEAGRMELELASFELAAAIAEALALVRERAGRSGIQISAEVPADLGAIEADERKVKQVLLNLLANAVKFTPQGGWVGVIARRQDGEVQVSVRDTGIGIAAEDQARVFEEFQQLGRGPERAREGTGLGLALSRRFVELHGGRIWLESEVGKGSTFTFALPARQPASVPAAT